MRYKTFFVVRMMNECDKYEMYELRSLIKELKSFVDINLFVNLHEK